MVPGIVILAFVFVALAVLLIRLRRTQRVLDNVQGLFDLHEVAGTVPNTELYNLALSRAVAMTGSRSGFVHVVSAADPSGPVPPHRCLSAPVIDQGREILIFVVCNKRRPYTSADRHRLNIVTSKLGRLIAKLRVEQELRDSLSHIQTLHGLIPICAWCKKVRDDEGYWSSVEKYFTERTAATFTHGICPECKKKTIQSGPQ